MSSPYDPTTLPLDLPAPVDDRACDHLPGAPVLAIALPSTSGRSVAPATLPGCTIIYCYPRSGRPGMPPPEGWDWIPGARGCTPESCGFRDHYTELKSAGVAAVFGLSTQTSDYQKELVDRLHLPFEVLSDADFEFANALRLPTFEVRGMTLIKRLTLVLRDGRIEKVFYPVFPPDRHAQEVLAWLQKR